MNLNEVSKNALENAKRREANGAKIDCHTLSMLKHCAGEVIEATEATEAYAEYRDIKNLAEDLTATDLDEKWESQEEPDVCEEYYQECESKFSSELADIICCVLIISAKEGIDIEKAVSDCLQKTLRELMAKETSYDESYGNCVSCLLLCLYVYGSNRSCIFESV